MNFFKHPKPLSEPPSSFLHTSSRYGGLVGHGASYGVPGSAVGVHGIATDELLAGPFVDARLMVRRDVPRYTEHQLVLPD